MHGFSVSTDVLARPRIRVTSRYPDVQPMGRRPAPESRAMTTPDSYRPYVGTVHFPRTTTDLTSTTQCPACFTPLQSAICSSCGLDLNHPAAVELATLSASVAADLDRRLELIGRMRYETAQLAAEVFAPVAPAAARRRRRGRCGHPRRSDGRRSPARPRVHGAGARRAVPRRHLGVQVILLIVGVSLLAVGAIAFLVYAFINFGIAVQSLIIGGVTIAAFVSASLLRWRKLTASAEGTRRARRRARLPRCVGGAVPTTSSARRRPTSRSTGASCSSSRRSDSSSGTASRVCGSRASRASRPSRPASRSSPRGSVATSLLRP